MSDFNEIWSLSTDFHESLQCQISRKSAQWELRWCVRTDRGMDRHDEGNKRLFFLRLTRRRPKLFHCCQLCRYLFITRPGVITDLH